MTDDLTTYSRTRLEGAEAVEYGDGTGEPTERLLAIRAEITRRDEPTCRCGMWPVDEYGPTCPSCHYADEDDDGGTEAS